MIECRFRGLDFEESSLIPDLVASVCNLANNQPVLFAVPRGGRF